MQGSRRASPPRLAGGARALRSLAAAAMATMFAVGGAGAQTSGYNPYQTQGGQGAGTASGADPYGTGGSGGSGSGGQGGQYGQYGQYGYAPNAGQQGYYSGYPGANEVQTATPGPYSPMSIQGQGVLGGYGANGAARAEYPVQAPTDGSNPGPLYLRPGKSPGEFELFQTPPPAPSEFETFVDAAVGMPLPRFGSALILNRARGFALATTTAVPPDYRLNPGDELLLGVTGSVESNLRLVIDSEGRIFVPRIGAISVAGLRYGDLAATLSRRLAEQFKQAKVSVVISHLRGVNVYVTGFAVNPGAYTVSSLSTMAEAVLSAGGPAAGGSFRSIQLRRGGQTVTTLDLYDLLLNGDRTHDPILQNDDVINIGPVGPELAVTGSVNAEAIYEAKAGETLGDMIRYAGGLNSLADDSRVIVSRLADLDAAGSQQLTLAAARAFPAERGDIVRILSLARVARPQERQAILATIEGEVDHPGRYYLSPGSTLADLVDRAGGLTSGAFVFGTKVEREAIKQQQQVSFDKAIDNLELTAAALPLSASLFNGGATLAAARSQGAIAILDRLKNQKPDGRVVLDLAPDAASLPGKLALENNDRIFVPPRPKTVGVFGAVYQAGSFLYRPGARVRDFVKEAGGPQKIADRDDIFVVRANGAVLSNRAVHDLGHQPALPGDVVFVPVRTSASLLDKILTVGAVLDQFTIGALTLTALGL
jgi:protein involved in polysaccharide export with SLBB domain